METTTKTRNGLQVSEATAKFVDALKSYDAFKNKLLEALCYLYGEDQGERFYNDDDHQTPLNAVDSVIFEDLGFSVRDSQGWAHSNTI